MAKAPRGHGVGAAFGYAFEGLATAWRTQLNVRIHTVVAAAVVAGGLVLHLRPLAWAVVVLTIAFVVATELANTALEAVVDLASPEYHPLAKRAKDIAAAAVLVAAAGAVVVAVLVVAGAAGARVL